MKPLFRCLSVVLILGVVAGCGKKEGGAEAPAVAEVTVPPFTYTDTPTLEMIPPGGVKGEVDGAEFDAVTMYIEPGLEGWALNVVEKEFETLEDVYMMDSRGLVLEFAKEPAAGQVYTHPMGFSDELNGYFTLLTENDNDEDGQPDIAPWNVDHAYVVEITDWELGPFDPEASDFQVKGKASGKFALCVPKDDTYEASWVAGTFENIPVRYSGEPAW